MTGETIEPVEAVAVAEVMIPVIQRAMRDQMYRYGTDPALVAAALDVIADLRPLSRDAPHHDREGAGIVELVWGRWCQAMGYGCVGVTPDGLPDDLWDWAAAMQAALAYVRATSWLMAAETRRRHLAQALPVLRRWATDREALVLGLVADGMSLVDAVETADACLT